MMYRYGMRLRPFSIGCQPMEGLEYCEENNDRRTSGYWEVIVYNRKLTEQEVEEYELDFLDKNS